MQKCRSAIVTKYIRKLFLGLQLINFKCDYCNKLNLIKPRNN